MIVGARKMKKMTDVTMIPPMMSEHKSHRKDSRNLDTQSNELIQL